jgi:hypothetical protein
VTTAGCMGCPRRGWPSWLTSTSRICPRSRTDCARSVISTCLRRIVDRLGLQPERLGLAPITAAASPAGLTITITVADATLVDRAVQALLELLMVADREEPGEDLPGPPSANAHVRPS